MNAAQIALYGATVKADIAANADLNSQPLTADGADAIARLYNAPSSPALLLWDRASSVAAIEGAINRAAYTPNDVPDGTLMYANRCDVVQIKQANLLAMLSGRASYDASKLGARASLRDAVIQLPAGTAGVMVSAGGASGVTVLTACTRTATRLEKLLALASAPLGNVVASDAGFEGTVAYADIQVMR